MYKMAVLFILEHYLQTFNTLSVTWTVCLALAYKQVCLPVNGLPEHRVLLKTNLQ